MISLADSISRFRLGRCMITPSFAGHLKQLQEGRESGRDAVEVRLGRRTVLRLMVPQHDGAPAIARQPQAELVAAARRGDREEARRHPSGVALDIPSQIVGVFSRIISEAVQHSDIRLGPTLRPLVDRHQVRSGRAPVAAEQEGGVVRWECERELALEGDEVFLSDEGAGVFQVSMHGLLARFSGMKADHRGQ